MTLSWWPLLGVLRMPGSQGMNTNPSTVIPFSSPQRDFRVLKSLLSRMGGVPLRHTRRFSDDDGLCLFFMHFPPAQVRCPLGPAVRLRLSLFQVSCSFPAFKSLNTLAACLPPPDTYDSRSTPFATSALNAAGSRAPW